MPGTFLEDLTRAGRAVWEYYLKPFDTETQEIPPTFPVFEAVTEAENFANKYGSEYDWRTWLTWATAFSYMGVAFAESADTPAEYNTLDKFTELNAIHMGERHSLEHNDSPEFFRMLPPYLMPTWSYGSRDMEKFRFEVAAYQEWLLMESVLLNKEFPEARREEIMSLASELENDLFKDAEFETILGLMVLSMHMATLGMRGLSADMTERANRYLCVHAHGIVRTVKDYIAMGNFRRILGALFRTT